MKIKKKHHKYYLLSFAVIAILTYSLLFTNVLNLKKGSQKYIEIVATPTQQQKVYEEREYISELGFKITMPEGYEIEENVNLLKLNKNNKSIVIDEFSTNASSLMDFINDLENKNKLNIRVDNETKRKNYMKKGSECFGKP